MATYTGAGAVVVMDPSPLVYVKVFNPASGPDRHIKGKANEVAVLARALAPKRSGNLARSVAVSQSRDEKGRFAFGYAVSASASYAGYVHEGTGPSLRQTFPFKMQFMGTGPFSGTRITTDIVRHPGTPANPFLEEALVAMVG